MSLILRFVSRRLSHAVRRWLPAALLYFACWGLLFPPHLTPQVWGQQTGDAGATTRPAGGVTPAVVAGDLRRSFAALERLLREMPQQEPDPQAIVKQAQGDPARLSAWVRQNTALVPYRGVLRGASGVLADRVGNSLDRALLLAHLVQQAGHEVRLANAELGAEQVREDLLPLVRRRPAKPQAREEVADRDWTALAGDALPGRPEELLDALQLNRQQALEEIFAAVAGQSELLLKAVAATDGVAERGPDPLSLRDHWWVQVRDGERWQSLDPALDAGKIPEPRTTTATADLPDELYGRLRLRVLAARRDGAATTEAAALDHTFRLADLAGEAVRLRYVPLDWPQDLNLLAQPEQVGRGLRKALLAQYEWVPQLLVGDQTVEQASFDDLGRIHENPAKGIQGRKVRGAAGAIGQLGARDTGVLVSVIVEHEVLQPGHEPLRIRRPVFDLTPDGPEAAGKALVVTEDQRLSRGLALMAEHDLLAVGFAPSPEQMTQRALRALLGARPAVLGILEAEGEDADSQVKKHLTNVQPFAAALHALSATRLAAAPWREHIYLDRPNVIAHERRLLAIEGPNARLRESYDIIHNPVAVGPWVEDEAEARRLRVRQGVLDTVLESSLLARQGGSAPHSAAAAFAAAIAAGTEPIVIRSPQDLKDQMQKVPPGSRGAVEADLADGFTVLLPSAGAPVWYRVGPDGQTLGRIDAGEGGSVTGYVILLGGIAGALVAALLWIACTSGGPGDGDQIRVCFGCALIGGFATAALLIALIGVRGLSSQMIAAAVATVLALVWYSCPGYVWEHLDIPTPPILGPGS